MGINNVLSGLTLQGRKQEQVLFIVLYNILHRAVTKVTNPVKENEFFIVWDRYFHIYKDTALHAIEKGIKVGLLVKI